MKNFLIAACLAVFSLGAIADDVPPPPAFNGDYEGFNLQGEYGTCVDKVLSQFTGLDGFGKVVAAEKAQEICLKPVQAWHNVNTQEQQARMAEANAPKWWHRLIPSGDTLLGVGANVYLGSKRYKYQYKSDREMWGAISELGSNGPPGNFDVAGGEGDMSFNFDSPGSFNGGDTSFDSSGAFGSDSFNETRTETRTDTTQDSFNPEFGGE